MKPNGLNMGQVKKQNRSSILRYMNAIGPVSRKDIADVTGLTAAAVTQISGAMLEEGILKEVGIVANEKSAGRKKILLEINYDFAYIISVNIEQEKTLVALTNLKGDPVDKASLSTTVDANKLLDDVVTAVMKLQKKHPAEASKVAGVCVVVPGLVDKEQGVSIHAYGIWEEEVAIKEYLKGQLHLDVIVENNVNALGNAQLLFDHGKTYDNLLIVKWGPGVGSSIIIDRKVYDGRNGKAAEIGHFIVEKDGKRCSCGKRGCLTTKISSSALEEAGASYMAEAIDLFARSVVNSMTMLAPNRVILCGSMFHDKKVQSDFIAGCAYYDAHYNDKRILASNLIKQEAYIGPVATFVLQEIF